MSEADLKRTVGDFLEYGQNQGKWVYLRLNAGDFIEVRGNTRRRIKGCQKGTADFLVITHRVLNGFVLVPLPAFIELKSEKGKQSKEQKEFQVMVETQGCGYHLIRSFEELEEILK